MALRQIKKSIYKRWWFWLAIALTLAAVGGTVGGYFAINNRKNSPIHAKYYIGDTVTLSDAQFCVVSVTNQKILPSNDTEIASTTNFVVVTLQVANLGTRDLFFSLSCFTLKKGSLSYEIHPASAFLENGFYVIAAVSANSAKTLRFAYETPQTTLQEEFVLTAKASGFATTSKIMLKNKPL